MPKILFLGFISIFYERLKNTNKKYKNLKAKIYHIILKTILQHISPSFFFVEFKKKDTNDFAILLEHKNGIELIYVDDYKRCCYPILVGFMVDYKKQVLIIGIKANMQYSICLILSKKRELIT